MGKVKGGHKRTTRSSVRPGFTRECRCTLHESFDSDTSVRLYSTTSKDFRQSALTWLIDHHFQTPRNKYICGNCLDYASKQLDCSYHPEFVPECPGSGIHPASNPSNLFHESVEDLENNPIEQDTCSNSVDNPIVHDVIQLLKFGELSDKDKKSLCKEIGSALSKEVYADTKSLHGQYSDLGYLTSINCEQFLQSRPAPLVSFLLGLTSVQLETCDKRKLYAICLALEQLYFVRNSNFVGPFSFSQSIVKWAFCGSKAAHTLDGCTTASGSITTLKTVLNSASSSRNQCFESGDVDVFADNTQRTGKTSRVREDGTAPVGVATNVVFIKSNPETTLQERSDLSPKNWRGKIPDVSHKITETEHKLNTSVFRPYRQSKQIELLNNVIAEMSSDSMCNLQTNAKDHVQISCDLHDVSPEKCVCVKCRHIYLTIENVCPKCGYNPNNLPDRNTLYGDVPDQHPSDPPSIKIGEIIGVNPNSKLTIRKVLDDIAKQTGLNNTRSWVRVGFDGIPYRIASDLIENIVVCDICETELDLSKKSFESHVAENHPGMLTVDRRKVFGDIFLVPGAGHMEKNLLLALFSLCRVIFMEKVADCLGFRSKRAKLFIMSCGNHHVSWQILYIVYRAFAQELIHTYVCECRQENVTPTVNGFVSWRNNKVVNPNFNLIYDLTFNCCLGLLCFRSGVRRNNSKFAIAGRQKVAPLMYLKNHTIYQSLIVKDMEIREEAPDELKTYIERNEAFARSGDHLRGEGGDYLTENENRNLKSHLPPGIPTMQNWIVSSRCHEKLVLNRAAVFQRANLKDPGMQESSIFHFDKEIQMLRRVIREQSYLSDPYDENPKNIYFGFY